MQRIWFAKASESKGTRLGLSAPEGEGARALIAAGLQISIYSYKIIILLIITPPDSFCRSGYTLWFELIRREFQGLGIRGRKCSTVTGLLI